MCQEGPVHPSGAGCRADRRKFGSMSDQTTSVERDPLTCIRNRLVGKPQKFFAPFVCRRRRSVLRPCLIFQRQANPMAFRQGKRLKWAQYSLLVNGVKLSDHGTFIVAFGGVSHHSSSFFRFSISSRPSAISSSAPAHPATHSQVGRVRRCFRRTSVGGSRRGQFFPCSRMRSDIASMDGEPEADTSVSRISRMRSLSSDT